MESLLSPGKTGLREGSQLHPQRKDSDPGAVLREMCPSGCWEECPQGLNGAKEHQALGTGTRGTEVLQTRLALTSHLLLTPD